MSGAGMVSAGRVGWANRLAGGDGREGTPFAIRKIATSDEGVPDRIGAREKYRPDFRSMKHFVNRAWCEAAGQVQYGK